MPPGVIPGGVRNPPPNSHKSHTKWAYYVQMPKTHKVAVSVGGVTRYVMKTIPGTKRSGWVRVGSDLSKVLTSQNRHPVHYATNKTGKPPVFTPYPKNPPGYQGGRHPGPKGNGGVAGTHHPGKTYKPPANKPGAGNGPNNGNNKPGGGGKPPKNMTGKNMKAANQTIGKAAVNKMQNKKSADAIAGLQFDPQINDVKALLARLPRQSAQDAADITNWYKQVGDLNTQAGTRNAAETSQLSTAAGNATQRVLAAIGGSANASAGDVGATGNADQAMANMLGSVDQSYHNDMTPLLAQQAAGAKSAQAAADSLQTSQYQQQLVDLMGQRGQAKTAAIQQILAANNAAAQTNFGNRISKLQASAGIAQLMGAQQLQHQQIVGAHLANKGAAQQLAGGGSNTHPFGYYSPTDRATIIKEAVAMNTNGHAARSHAQALQALQGMGFHPNDPAVLQMLNTYYSPAPNGNFIPR